MTRLGDFAPARRIFRLPNASSCIEPKTGQRLYAQANTL